MAAYLIDTNVLSEMTRAKPDANVLRWWKHAEGSMFYISAITIGEIRNGICRLPENSRRRNQLEVWLEKDVISIFSDRIIPFGIEESVQWGAITAAEEQNGTCKPDLDMQIAATAMVHRLVLVTRNVDDFKIHGLRIENPFEGS